MEFDRDAVFYLPQRAAVVVEDEFATVTALPADDFQIFQRMDRDHHDVDRHLPDKAGDQTGHRHGLELGFPGKFDDLQRLAFPVAQKLLMEVLYKNEGLVFPPPA